MVAALPVKPDMTDVYAKLRAVDVQTITRGAFTSRAHDSAKRRMEKTAGKEESVTFAKNHFLKATMLWNELNRASYHVVGRVC